MHAPRMKNLPVLLTVLISHTENHPATNTLPERSDNYASISKIERRRGGRRGREMRSREISGNVAAVDLPYLPRESSSFPFSSSFSNRSSKHPAAWMLRGPRNTLVRSYSWLVRQRVPRKKSSYTKINIGFRSCRQTERARARALAHPLVSRHIRQSPSADPTTNMQRKKLSSSLVSFPSSPPSRRFRILLSRLFSSHAAHKQKITRKPSRNTFSAGGYGRAASSSSSSSSGSRLFRATARARARARVARSWNGRIKSRVQKRENYAGARWSPNRADRRPVSSFLPATVLTFECDHPEKDTLRSCKIGILAICASFLASLPH